MASERMSIRASSRQPILRLNQKEFKDNLNQLVIRTLESLVQVWAQAGYEDGECQMLLGDICIKFKGLCETELMAEQQILEHAKTQVREKIKEYVTYSNQLGREVQISENDLGNNYADKLAELEKRLSVVVAEVTDREALLNDEKYQIDDLVSSLGELSPAEDAFNGPPGTPKLSDVRLNLMIQHKQSLMAIKDKRIEDMKAIAMECNRNFVDLVMSEEGTGTMADSAKFAAYDAAVTTLAQSGEFTFGVNKTDLDMLRLRLKSLVAEKEQRRVELSSTGSEIARLWQQLKIPREEREAFQSSFQMNLSIATIMTGKNELNRLRKLRADSLGRVLEGVRQDILAMWSEAGIEDDSERRVEFPMFFEPLDHMLDSALEAHEEYASRIRARLEELRPILQKIVKREATVSERYELEQIMLNPERLTARGPTARSERKREEDMSRRVKVLDKITKELVTQIGAWEEQHGLFIYGGDRYVDRMQRQEEEYVEYRDSLRNSRKKKDGKPADVPAPTTTKKKVSTTTVTAPPAPPLGARPKDTSVKAGSGTLYPPTAPVLDHDKENAGDGNSIDGDDSDSDGISELTEIKERASTSTVPRMTTY